MSEYHCYEFVAVDKALTARQMRELRDISTRAEITPTRFWNEYHWGDLKARPSVLLAKYFDAHLHFADWGTTRFMVRLPAKAVDVQLLRRYMGDRLQRFGPFVTLDFCSDDESYEAEPGDPAPLAVLLPVRDLLLQGDYRPAFLAWLASVQDRDLDTGELMALVPDDLGALTPALEQLVELLGVDRKLLAAAMKHSGAVDTQALRRWVKELSSREKTTLLVRAAKSPDVQLGLELRSRFSRLSPNRSRQVPLSRLLKTRIGS